MKKNNIFTFSIILFLVLVVWIIVCGINYQKDYHKNYEAHQKIIDICNNSNEQITKEQCDEVISHGYPVMPDTFTVFFQLLINSSLSMMQLIAPIIIILLSSYQFYHDYSTGFYKNKLLRMSYKDFLLKEILKAYHYLWILPAFIFALFIVSYIISGHFDVNLTLSYYPKEAIPVSISILKNFIPFMIIFLINLIFNSIFYANLSLIPIKKNKNYIISILISYILFLFCDIFFEVLIGLLLFEKYLHIPAVSNLLNLFNCWVYDNIPSIPLYVFYCFCLGFISLLIVIYIYHDKEEVMIQSEK